MLSDLIKNSHHKPTARTVKQIVLQLADRQKYSPLHRQDCANTTLEQLADYCCVSPASISDALRCLEFLGIVKTIRKGGGINKLATVRNVNLSVFTQWGIPPFEPNKRRKQKPEHIGEIAEHIGGNSEHIGETSDQHGQHPQTLNELLNENSKSIRAKENENKTEQTFETDPYTALENLNRNYELPAWTEAEIAQVEAAQEMIREATKKFKGED